MKNYILDDKSEKGEIKNFWNAVHFHPTDAIEDKWGIELLTDFLDNGIANFVRVYAMLEDIVSRNENGELVYDFTLNDMRLDFLCEKNAELLICLNFMPDCIAKNPNQKMNVPRYKDKHVNNSVPADYSEWEQVCTHYIKHISERYGECVKKWYIHCWNEPDHEYWVDNKSCFEYDNEQLTDKLEEYIKLYTAFISAVEKSGVEIQVGGPSAAFSMRFFCGFIDYIAKNNVRLDFITMHAYSDLDYPDVNKITKICPENIVAHIKNMNDCLVENGIHNTQIVVDEWGAAAGGFLSIKKAPEMVLRENEYLPVFYFKLISLIIQSRLPVSHMLICLAGQHKAKYDFDGYRSMYTYTGYKKPIYNGYVLASLLQGKLLCATNNILAFKNGKSITVALFNLSENISAPHTTEETKLIIDGIKGKYKAYEYVIDYENSNSYGAWQSLGAPEMLTKELSEKIKSDGSLHRTELGSFSFEEKAVFTHKLAATGLWVITIEKSENID